MDTPLKLFRQVTDELHRLGMGDTEYWKILRTLTAGTKPLLEIDGAAELTDYREVPEFLNRSVTLTAWESRCWPEQPTGYTCKVSMNGTAACIWRA